MRRSSRIASPRLGASRTVSVASTGTLDAAAAAAATELRSPRRVRDGTSHLQSTQHELPSAQDQEQEPEQQEPGGASNESLMWELLYNPNYKLPTQEAEAAWQRAADEMGLELATSSEGTADGGPGASDMEEDLESLSPEQLTEVLTRRARVVAEHAFWDSIEWRIRTGMQVRWWLATWVAWLPAG
jgi:hypothetical protein